MAAQAVDLRFIASYSEQDCDHLLGLADMSERWLSDRDDLPNDLKVLGSQVLSFVALEHLDDEATQDVLEFGSAVANYTFSQMHDDENDVHYRADRAIETRHGNCIASHETVSGVLSVCGLGEQAVGYWSTLDPHMGVTNHAGSGLVIADRAIYIDGYFGKASLIQPTDPVAGFFDKVAGSDEVVIHNTSSGSNRTVNITDLHNVDIRSGTDNYTVMLDAAYAVLMFSAVSIVQSKNPRHAQAQRVLEEFAPVL